LVAGILPIPIPEGLRGFADDHRDSFAIPQGRPFRTSSVFDGTYVLAKQRKTALAC
jgi:hypothetical protein